jgi:hypothetical protein
MYLVLKFFWMADQDPTTARTGFPLASEYGTGANFIFTI